MSEDITVFIVRRKGGNYRMRYKDPETGRRVEKSAGTASKRKAEQAAREWQNKLNSGQYARGSDTPWKRLASEWIDEESPRLRRSTLTSYLATLNKAAKLEAFRTAGDLTTAKIANFAANLRAMNVIKSGKGHKGLSEATIAKHLRTIRALARWAHERDLIAKEPKIKMPSTKKTARAKGRPLTGEEFDRMLSVVPKVVGEDAAEPWRHLLGLMYWGGLRLGEALYLRWDERHLSPQLILDGPRSEIAFDHESHKNGEMVSSRLMRQAVELVEAEIGRGDEGFVIELPGRSRPASEGGKEAAVQWASKKIGKMGKLADIVTIPKMGRTATAHDLRRSFGYRWARRVPMASLVRLMRHASPQTTMSYYDSDLDDATAGQLWSMAGEYRQGADAAQGCHLGAAGLGPSRKTLETK